MENAQEQLVQRLLNIWLASYQRAPGVQKRQQFAACIRLIILNLLRAETRSEGLAVGIGTSKQRLDASRRYHPAFMSVDYFVMAMRLLTDQGITYAAAPGYQNDGLAQVARYALTETAKRKLLRNAPPSEAYRVSTARETVILKDKEGRLAKYAETERTTAMRNALARINDTIAAAHIGSTRPLVAAFDLDEEHALGTIQLYRVFNNGTFAQGGRFYGGWWQHSRRHFRPLITLNGEATIEADFTGLHPSMLFAKHGLPIPKDPYALVRGVDGDATLRKHAKTTFVAMLNANRGGTEEPRNFDSAHYGMSGKEFQSRVRGAFPMLPNIFGSGIGLHLQREDSDLAEQVMLHFIDRGIPILPIHDSFIVAQRHENELVQVMADTFKQTYRQDIGVSVKASGS